MYTIFFLDRNLTGYHNIIPAKIMSDQFKLNLKRTFSYEKYACTRVLDKKEQNKNDCKTNKFVISLNLILFLNSSRIVSLWKFKRSLCVKEFNNFTSGPKIKTGGNAYSNMSILHF